jgi:hypothetical protein
VPHVRPSVRGPKKMGAAQRSLFAVSIGKLISDVLDPSTRATVHTPRDCQRANGSDLQGNAARAIVGLRPSFSAHVRLGERGAPVDSLQRGYDTHAFGTNTERSFVLHSHRCADIFLLLASHRRICGRQN